MSNYEIAQRMQQIPFSPIRKIFERVNQLKQQKHPVIHLEVGRPDFDTPEHIKHAGANAMERGQVHYTSNYGIEPLRQAISEKLARDNQVFVNPDNEVIVTAGVSEAIMISMMALLNPGDEVLIPEPLFPCHTMSAEMAGAVVVPVPVFAEHGYKPQVTDLMARVTDKTRMMVLTTPGNPTGVVLDRETLGELAQFAIDQDLLVLSDEIYEKLIYEGHHHLSIASFPGMHSRTLTCNGFSKSYAMTGWRLGYVVGDKHLIDALIRIHQYTVVCTTSFSQWGGVAALNGPQQPMLDMVDELDSRRQLLMRELDQIPGVKYVYPQGAMYLYCDVSGLTDDAFELAEALLEQAYIALVPWDKKHIRISYGNTYDNLQQAMHRFQAYVHTHCGSVEAC